MGPYQDETTLSWEKAPQWLKDHNNDPIGHPTPFYDIPNPPSNAMGWHCGFSSEEQMNKWFTLDQQRELTALGFPFYVFEVPDYDVLIGRCQCVFRPHLAVRIEELKR